MIWFLGIIKIIGKYGFRYDFRQFGIVNAKGEILVSKVFKTRSKEPFTSFLKELVGQIKELNMSLGAGSKILAVGVGVPNANSNPGNAAILGPAAMVWKQFET